MNAPISPPARRPRPRSAGASGVWTRWTVAATVGELAGFTVPAVAGAAVSAAAAPDPVIVATLVAAGFLEGVTLGFAQSGVLGRAAVGVRRRDWTLATGAGAAIAWLLGMLPSTFAGRVPSGVLWALVAVVAPVLLVSLGLAQWLVLRRHRTGSAWWIAATAGAWLAGLAVFTGISSPLWRPDQSTAVVAAVGVLSGAAMAATTAALTGLAAVRLMASTPGGP